jgi:pilus assembly protein CpaB
MLKGKTPVLVAVFLGTLAGAVAWAAVKRKEREVKAGWTLVPVLVASRDLAEGSVVSWDSVSQRPIPEQFVTSSVVKPDSATYVIGQKVLVPLQAGDPLLWTQFEASRASERLSTTVVQKMRAITLDASGSKMGVGGWIRPNDHIDLLGTFRDPNTAEQTSVTLMQNVMVIAAGKLTGNTNVNLLPENAREFSSLTLLVLPEEAEILSLASDLGSLTATLRNPADIDTLEARGRTTLATLLTGVRETEFIRRRAHLITMIRKNDLTQESVPTP